MTERVIGTITDAEDRYDLDGAGVWQAICWNEVVRNPEGELVRLIAREEDREGALWIVKEVMT